MLKQLTEQDAGFLYLETSTTPQHVGGVSLVELPEGQDPHAFYSTYKQHISRRLHLVPFLQSKLLSLPLDFDRPFWVHEQHVDLDYHIRRHTLPAPGTSQLLEELVGRLHSNFLDRSRPLWEFYVIDGLASGHVAIYTKIHHAAMDGASSQALIQAMYDPTPRPRELDPPAAPADALGELSTDKSRQLLKAMWQHTLRQEVRWAKWLPDAMKSWTDLVLPNTQTLRYDPFVAIPRTPHTMFNVNVSSQRIYAARTLELPRIKRIAKQAGAKVNDVVLTLCGGALRRFLAEKGELPKRSLTTLVPVALQDNKGTADANHNYMFVCSLSTHLADPAQRLQAVCQSTSASKSRLHTLKGALLPDISLFCGGAVVKAMVGLYCEAKLAERLPPLGNVTISNVPGPPIDLYVAGGKLVSMHPCSIPFHGGALNITCESYHDRLDFGLIACRRTVPDLAVLADYLVQSADELEQAVVAAEATGNG